MVSPQRSGCRITFMHTVHILRKLAYQHVDIDIIVNIDIDVNMVRGSFIF